MIENTTDTPVRSEPAPEADTGSGHSIILDMALILAKYRIAVLVVPLVAAVIAAGISFVLPNTYTATTRILPPQQPQSAAAAMLSQLSSVAGLGASTGIKNPADLYIGMLKSRTVEDRIIQRFDLMSRYEQKLQSSTRKVLQARTSTTVGRDGIITVEVDDRDPQTAADLANAYVEELTRLTNVLAVTEASQRRLFFEKQMAKAREDLARSEVVARQAMEKGGLVKLDEQGRAIVETTARLRAQITSKEVQLGAMRTFAADGNPELILVREELSSLRRELAKIEGVKGFQNSANGGESAGVANFGLLRTLKYNEVLFELLAKQYEMAKIDEARDSSMIQVVDVAVTPDTRSKPVRRVIVLVTYVVALLVSFFWILANEILSALRADSRYTARVAEIRRNLAWR